MGIVWTGIYTQIAFDMDILKESDLVEDSTIILPWSLIDALKCLSGKHVTNSQLGVSGNLLLVHILLHSSIWFVRRQTSF